MARSIVLFLLFLLFITTQINAQKFEWAKSAGGTSYDESYAIATDRNGNSYITGDFNGTVDFDPGAGIFNLTSAGSRDIFIQKLDASGNFVWAKRMGGSNYDKGNSIAVDDSGNVYTIGNFVSTVDFDPGTGTAYLSSTAGEPYNTDIFIQKLNTAGNFVWAKSMGGGSDDQGWSITIDGLGNVYTTGTFRETADFNPGTVTFNLTSAGDVDIFVSKLDALGNFVWAKRMGGISGDSGSFITVDDAGNIYTTGSFEDTVDFNPGTGITNIVSAGFSDIFVQKLDALGNYIWAKSMKGADYDHGSSIAKDKFGNIYVTGYFRDSVDFDPGAGTIDLISAGTNDIFILKLDAFGNYIWAKSIGGTLSDIGKSVVADSSGNIYITGNFFSNPIDFNPGIEIYNLITEGGSDIFILKLDSSGNFKWAKNVGSPSYDYGSGIAVTDSGSIFITGTFETTVDFDPDTGIANLTSVGLRDFFVVKLSQGTTVDIHKNIKPRLLYYPNPIRNTLYIELDNEGQNTIEVLNLFGKIMMNKTYYNQNQISIEMSNFNEGIYLVKIINQNGQSVIKVIKCE